MRAFAIGGSVMPAARYSHLALVTMAMDDMRSTVLVADEMADGRPTRFNVVLDEEHATKLYLMAERTCLQPGALAGWGALDDADHDGRTITALLDAIPERGSQFARARRTSPPAGTAALRACRAHARRRRGDCVSLID